MFDWKNRPEGSLLYDVDDMPIVVLPGGACVSAKTGVEVSSGRVTFDGIEVSSEAEFEFMVNTPRPDRLRTDAERAELERNGWRSVL